MQNKSYKKYELLKKKVFILLFFLITFFVFNNNVKAAYFNYADFDFDKFAEENKDYWTGYCVNELDKGSQEKCIELVISKQRLYYTRLYKLLAKYQKKGYFIDDNILIMTTFFELTPDLFTDSADAYKNLTGSAAGPYQIDKDLDVDNYDVDAEPDPNYFIKEKDTLDLLIKNMFGYVSKCYGLHGDVVKKESDDGTTIDTCPLGGTPMTVDGKYRCASTADSAVVGFWEYMAIKSGVNWFFGLKNNHQKHCDALSTTYPEGTSYEMLNKKQYSPETLNKYWEFLENSTYFDNKAHLKHYFQTILNKTNLNNMKEFHDSKNDDITEEYHEDLIVARKKIVKNIKSILASRGTKVDNINLMNINNSLYWWPVGSAEITTDGSGVEYALGDPFSLSITSPFGYRVHPTTGKTNSFHYGLDIGGAGQMGVLNIIAARAGIVENVVIGCNSGGESSCGGGYGNYIVISHGDGNYTLYAHLHENSITVQKGQSVNQGQVIGKMGSSGRSTGSHLHFEIRIGSNDISSAVDPLNYISAENPRASTFEVQFVEGNTNQETVCKTLLASGYSTNGTIGLMINAKAESSFNPIAEGDNGTSYGLFQWHKTRKANLINMYRGTYSNIDSQISFLKYELENGYYNLYEALVRGTESGFDLGYKFCVEFERPAGGSSTCQKRSSSHIDEMTSYVSNNCG
ncbi:MAG: phage tail tip lysozyme [Bacilli bacterium]|nr:phage tail tip lysozyme [Bacilli bacterium]